MSTRRSPTRVRGRSRKPATFKLGTGWLPEKRDPRDYTPDHESVAAMLEKVGIVPFLRGTKALPPRVDLRRWCPPVRFQGGYNDCAANVVAELVEFFQKKAFGRSVRASRLFLYKAARNLLRLEGNTAVYIRQVMGALKLVGVPPERYWPYLKSGTLAAPATNDPRLDAEPTAFCYALADDYRAVSYYRFDSPNKLQSGADLLRLARAHLAAQIPFAFGFPLYESIHQSMKGGKVPYPARGENQLANHAVLAVGYDDRLAIRNRNRKGPSTVGALLIQNSWGSGWGNRGFGWIPYAFVLEGRARDFWTLIKADWVETGQFQFRF
jgi:C1A family cysteine protease